MEEIMVWEQNFVLLISHYLEIYIIVPMIAVYSQLLKQDVSKLKKFKKEPISVKIKLVYSTLSHPLNAIKILDRIDGQLSEKTETKF